jgi:hypothetical protein
VNRQGRKERQETCCMSYFYRLFPLSFSVVSVALWLSVFEPESLPFPVEKEQSFTFSFDHLLIVIPVLESIKGSDMTAKQLHIKGRNQRQMRDLSSLRDFTWGEGDTVDAQQIVHNPKISLYCLDDARQEAIFTVLPEDIDLSQVPFVYQAQFDHTEYLIAVPYSIFLQLADNLSVDASQLICIHNVGRCGSTLLSQALNELESVTSLSEPDIFANFITIRHTPREEQIHLLQASYKFMFRPAVVGDTTRYVLKFRNHCADIMDLFAEAFPTAKHLFMYRNGLDWVASLYRIIYKTGRANMRLTLSEAIEQHGLFFNRPDDDFSSLFDSTKEDFSLPFCRAVLWVHMMTRYIEIYENGFRPITIRYEDLIEQCDETLSAIFEKLGLPKTAVSQAKKAFERDSQAGTKLARDDAQSGNVIQLPEEDVNNVHLLLAKYEHIRTSDVILPDTLHVD